MTTHVPDDLWYSADHAWLRRDDSAGEVSSDEVVIGITDFAQEQLGDVVYLELPEAGAALIAGEPFGEIESAKTVVELFAPVSGELLEVNARLEAQPELVNESPYDNGWVARVRLADASELATLLDATMYRRQLPEE